MIARSAKHARVVAGVDIAGPLARVALVECDAERRTARAVEREPLAPGAMERGVIRDPDAVERAVRAALARAEDRADRRAELLAVATATDDLRVHRQAWRAARAHDTPLRESELHRASERACATATRDAVAAVSDEPALRRGAIVPLQTVTSRVRLDGNRLVAPGRQRGEVLEIEVVVPIVPLAQSSGLEAAIAPLGRNTRLVAAALALGALAGESGVGDAIVAFVGSEVTSIAVVRDGAPAGARSFSLGDSSFAARPPDAARGDAAVWARCVALAAGAAIDGRELPGRAFVSAEPTRLESLMGALEEVLGERQPGGATVSALGPTTLSRLESDVPLDASDLVAVAAAAV